MSDYSKVNFLKDVENSSKAEGLEALFTREHLESRDLGVSLFRYEPNYKSEMAHSHKEQEEVYVVIKGSGSLLLDETIVELSQWDVVRVAPNIVRSFAAGAQGIEVIAVGGPKPEGGDGEMHTPNWSN